MWILPLIVLIVLFLMKKTREYIGNDMFLNQSYLTINDRLREKRERYWDFYTKKRKAKEEDNQQILEELKSNPQNPVKILPVDHNYPFGRYTN